MVNRFAVVDVETANSDVSSICQIGIVVYENGRLTESWSSLVNPQTDFDWMNIFVHGIDEDMVADAPTLDELKPTLERLFTDTVVCSYSAFDRRAIGKNYPEMVQNYPWLDIMRVARYTWREKFFNHGYGLANVTETLGIMMDKHHDALSDAKAAAEVLLQATATENHTPHDWIDAVRYRAPKLPTRDEQAINEDGDYIGSVCVFTGELSLVRSEATRLANDAGFAVAPSVTKKTTHLIVGVQDPTKLKGSQKSSKERKALELTQKGQNIVFLTEQDFFDIIQSD